MYMYTHIIIIIIIITFFNTTAMYPVLANNLDNPSICLIVDIMVGRTSLLSTEGVVTDCTVSNCDCNPVRYHTLSLQPLNASVNLRRGRGRGEEGEEEKEEERERRGRE